MKNKFILLVEDNPDDATLAVRALRKNNIWADVEIVHDGVEALDFLFGTGTFYGRDVNDRPALILLDLGLPRVHGFEVLRRLRTDNRMRDLPVIIITSSWNPDDILQGYSLRADGYVCKTVSFDKFVAALGHLSLDGLLGDEPARARVEV